MADNIQKIATKLGAKVIASGINTGGGAFGAACLLHTIAKLGTRLISGQRDGSESSAYGKKTQHKTLDEEDEETREWIEASLLSLFDEWEWEWSDEDNSQTDQPASSDEHPA